MGGDPKREPPYEEAAALYDYFATARPWIEGEAALSGLGPVERLPARRWLAVVYAMILRDDKDHAEARERLDETLAALNAPLRETWGRLPSQQRAMARAAYAGSQGG